MHAADQRATTIIERAHREAQVLKTDADEYARSVLLSLEGQLDGVDQQIATLLTTVQNGLDTLSQAHEETAVEEIPDLG